MLAGQVGLAGLRHPGRWRTACGSVRWQLSPNPAVVALWTGALVLLVAAAARGIAGWGYRDDGPHAGGDPEAAQLFVDAKFDGSIVRPLPAPPRALVCICTHYANAEPALFIDLARSVFNQTLSNWDWVVVDDSTDAAAAAELLLSLPALDKRLRVAPVADYADRLDAVASRAIQYGLPVGAGAAHQVGALACGDVPYILYLDMAPPDASKAAIATSLHPTAVEKIFWFMHTHTDAHFVSAWVSDRGRLRAGPTTPSLAFRDGDPANGTLIAHRSASLRRIGGPSQRRGALDGWDTLRRYAAEGLWGGTVSEVLATRQPLVQAALDEEQRGGRGGSDHYDGSDVNAAADQGARRAVFAEIIADTPPRLAEDAAWPPEPVSLASTYELGGPALLPLGATPDTLRLPLEPVGTAGPRPHRHMLLLLPWMALGGADRFNLDLMRHLSARGGWSFTIVATLPSSNTWQREYEAYTRDILLLPSLMPQTAFLEAVHNVIAWRRVDVVLLTHSWHGYPMLPFLAQAHPAVALVDYNHMEEDWWRLGGHPRNAVVLNPLLDASFVCSEHLRRWMVRRGADAARVETRYAGIDAEDWAPPDAPTRAAFRRSLGIPVAAPAGEEAAAAAVEPFVVLFAGRLAAQKQPLLFARVVQALLQEQVTAPAAVAAATAPVHFIVAGGGPLQGALLAELERVPAATRGAVHWVGSLPPAAMREATAASDALVLPSLHEGIPLVFYEAAALGVVVVGADVGGCAEAVAHGESGFLVPPRGPAEAEADAEERLVHAFAAALGALRDDPALRRAMSARARLRVRSFSQRAMFAQLDDDLRWLVARKAQRWAQERGADDDDVAPLAVDGGGGGCVARMMPWCSQQPPPHDPVRASAAADEVEVVFVGDAPELGPVPPELTVLAEAYRWGVRAEDGERLVHPPPPPRQV